MKVLNAETGGAGRIPSPINDVLESPRGIRDRIPIEILRDLRDRGYLNPVTGENTTEPKSRVVLGLTESFRFHARKGFTLWEFIVSGTSPAPVEIRFCSLATPGTQIGIYGNAGISRPLPRPSAPGHGGANGTSPRMLAFGRQPPKVAPSFDQVRDPLKTLTIIMSASISPTHPGNRIRQNVPERSPVTLIASKGSRISLRSVIV